MLRAYSLRRKVRTERGAAWWKRERYDARRTLATRRAPRQNLFLRRLMVGASGGGVFLLLPVGLERARSGVVVKKKSTTGRAAMMCRMGSRG